MEVSHGVPKDKRKSYAVDFLINLSILDYDCDDNEEE